MPEQSEELRQEITNWDGSTNLTNDAQEAVSGKQGNVGSLGDASADLQPAPPLDEN